ncbi:T9SS type A sorting domain-containing protein [Winogradskyella aurantiaca]|uniref:T9SS type A sorting domain-containing protein n=1 Tax=Winogradskyella aurantiaca TaxID=2219558 RepID=UPI000E1DC4B4|nr:T9SS type A sorting domain-containing protein [Winogradskyella aurantiaca]
MFNLKSINLVILLTLFSFEMSFVCAQTILNVEPTRVTWESKVTITGTGFTPGMENNLIINGIAIDNETFVNSETITFEINETSRANDASEDINPFNSASNDRLGRVLTFNGSSTSVTFDFIAPTIRVHRKTGSATNPVDQITEIFTNMNGFSRFSSKTDIVDDKHELLAFTYKGVTYSTGVDDQLLTDNAITFVSQEYKAYSTNGVEGTTNSGHYLAAADSSDGLSGSPESDGTPASNYSDLNNLLIYDTLIDGVNGLELGTGITNLNQNNTVRFFSGNGQVGALGNEIPDLVLTQIAQAGAWDIYYYADINGNVVGRPIRLYIEENQSQNEPLATNNWDFYRYQQNVSFDVAVPGNKALGDNATRPLRMMAFKLEEFAIDATNIADINNINMSAGGKADLAFMAYNKSAFAIRSPFISSRPPSRYVCELPSSNIISFEVGITIDGEENNSGYIPTADEALSYQWYKYNSELAGEIDEDLEFNGVSSSDLGTYRVIVSNTYGAVIVPVTLNEGGTPAFWNGSSWQLPVGYGSGPGEIAVEDKERSLRFDEDYNESVDLEGCDCTVSAGSDVVIPSGYSLKVFDGFTVEDEIPASTDIDGTPIPAVPAGTFVLENNASLVQINDVSTNDNTGEIDMKRTTSNLKLYDYIYWSSPVADFDLSDIPNDRSFLWDVRAVNANGTDGDWISYTGAMDMGRGYIARVPSAVDFTVDYKGVPNNGLVTRFLAKSVGAQDTGDKHWNLVGNPYPSAISAEKFLTHPANSRLTGAVYIWSRSGALSSSNPSPYYQDFVYSYADSFITYNAVGSVPSRTFSGNIAAGQGFFVKVDDGASEGNIEFRNTMRYGVSDSVLDNTDFYRTSGGNASPEPEPEKERVWLGIVDANDQSASTLIGYLDGATTGMDRLYEAFLNKGPNELAIYSPFEQGRMVIQGRPLPFDDTDVVNLGVQIPATGEYTIGIDKLDGEALMEEDLPIILEDLLTGLTYNLKEAPATITIDEGTYEDRFVLRYNANQLSTKDVDTTETIAYIKDDILHVQSSIVIDKVQVYDMTGKRVMEYEPETNSTTIQTDFNFSRGVYITLISLNGDLSISKKLIN